MKKFLAALAIAMMLSACDAGSKINPDLISRTDKGNEAKPVEITNSGSFFTKVSYISKLDSDIKAEIVQMFVEKEPEFYSPQIFKEKEELKAHETFEFSGDLDIRPFIAFYGWDVVKIDQKKQEKEEKNIVLDKNKFVKNYTSIYVFDQKNSLSYAVYPDEYAICYKMLKNKVEGSWRIKLPFVSKAICNRAINNKIVVYGDKDIMLIDTLTAKATAQYHINTGNPNILNVIPQKNLLWFIFEDTEHASYYAEKYKGSYLETFVIDTSKDSDFSWKFNDMIYNYKVGEGYMAILNHKNLYVVDQALNTTKYDMSEKFNDYGFDRLFIGYLSEVDCFIIRQNKVRYAIDLGNPYNLVDIPQGLYNLNYKYRGDNWDYYYIKDGYCYGYDIFKHETTWKIKAENNYLLPIYSTEYGILTATHYLNNNSQIVSAYTR